MKSDTAPYILIGATGQAKVIYEALWRRVQDLGEPHELLGIYDHSDPRPPTPIAGHRVHPQSQLKADIVSYMDTYEYINFYIATAYPNAPGSVRELLGNLWREQGLHPANVMHPTAYVSSHIKYWGWGTQVMAGVIINPGVRMGNWTLINTGAQIDHDCVIGDGVEIAPGVTICGNVYIDKYAIIFAGATVGPGVRIGEGAVVRAGAVVLGNVPDGETVQGIPARTLDGTKLLPGTWDN